MRFSPAALVSFALAGCATVSTDTTQPATKVSRTPVAQAPAVPAFHWEPLEVSVDPSITRAPLPLDEADVRTLGRAQERLRAMPQAARSALYARGFAVTDGLAAPSFGDFYRDLDGRELPLVVTVDALAEVMHLAVEAALASADDVAIAPALQRLLDRYAQRFESLVGRLPTDLQRPLRMARGIVAVARVLLDDTARAPADLAADVRDEVHRIRERFSITNSIVLQVPIEYAAITRSRFETAPKPLAEALGWLALAPMVLVSRDMAPGASVGTALSRDHTRAALLFAHAMHPRIDPDAAAEFARIDAIETFLLGPGDDWSPLELAAIAAQSGIDVADLGTLVDVPRIDRVRRHVSQSFRARVHDGSGAPGGVVTPEPPLEAGQRFVSRFVAPTARVLPARLGLDAVVQQALVAPVVGAYRGNRSVMTLGNGKRTLSRPLDFAIVLGSDEAREALSADGDDAYDDLDTTLRKLVDKRPPEREAARHASVYLSALDLLSSLLAPSAADASLPASADREHRRRMLEVTLTTYASMRHDFTRRSHDAKRVASEGLGPTTVVAKSPLVLVEPHPEAIGRMVALVRQVMRGLAAYRALRDGSAETNIISSAERLLTTAFQVALLMANGSAPGEEQAKALAAMPTAIRALERARGSRATRGIDMHVDLASGRVLAQGTGRLGELALVLRDPRDGKLVVAFGAASTHHELVHGRKELVSDADWTTRVERSAIPRAAWTMGYRFAR